MKKTFLSLAMLLSTMAVSAQSEAYVGDMNDDGELNISDVTQLVNTVIGKQAPRKVSLGGGDPYAVDNSAIAGTWRTTSGEVLTFNADGTCKISNTAYTFEYMPQLGFIAVYDSNGECPLSYNVLKKTNDMLLLNTMAQTGGKFYYTSAMFVTAIKLSSTSVNLNTGQTHQLTATVTPANAKVPTLKWTSSSTGVATVDQTGLVTAKKSGKATITAAATDGSGKKATCKVTVLSAAPTGVSLSAKSLSIKPSESAQLTATVTPSGASTATVIWTSSDPSVATVDKTGKVTAVGTEGKATITAKVIGDGSPEAKAEVKVQSDTHEYVDLDLPSGTLWATMNVGANAPEEYGGYYAWGETKAYGEEDTSNSHNYSYAGSYKKTYYYWSTYKWCDGTTYKGPFTKYNTDSSRGTVDNKKVLDLADDAAYVNWGENWRMPTKAEQDELRNNCTWTWTSINGKNGYKVSSKKDSSKYIFLPAAGCRCNGSLYTSLAATATTGQVSSTRAARTTRVSSTSIRVALTGTTTTVTTVEVCALSAASSQEFTTPFPRENGQRI